MFKLRLNRFSDVKLLTFHRHDLISDDELMGELIRRGVKDWRALLMMRANKAAA